VNYYLESVMQAGATGIQIKVAGKLGGEKSRFQKFKQGYIKHSGGYSDTMVEKGQAQAMLRQGIVGVEVKIMKGSAKEFILKKEIEKKDETIEAQG